MSQLESDTTYSKRLVYEAKEIAERALRKDQHDSSAHKWLVWYWMNENKNTLKGYILAIDYMDQEWKGVKSDFVWVQYEVVWLHSSVDSG